MAATAPAVKVTAGLQVGPLLGRGSPGFRLQVNALSIPPGALAVVTGEGGSGKSLLAAVLAGAAASEGRICVAGHELENQRGPFRARAGLAVVRQHRGIAPSLTVADHLALSQSRKSLGVPAQLADPTRWWPSLRAQRRQLAGNLSLIDQRALALGCALAGDPAVLVLDALTAGLPPTQARPLWGLVNEARRLGAAVLVLERRAEDVPLPTLRPSVLFRGLLRIVEEVGV